MLLTFMGSKSQDTLMFLNGKTIICNYVSTDSLEVDSLGNKIATKVHYEISKEKKNKTKTRSKKVSEYKLFAISTEEGRIYCYKQDTAMEDDFSVEQMESYVRGAQEGREHNVKKNVAGHVLVGAGGAFLGHVFYATMPIAGYLYGETHFYPDTTKMKVENKEDLKDDFFVEGYQRAVRDKRLRLGSIAASIGMTVNMFILHYVYTN